MGSLLYQEMTGNKSETGYNLHISGLAGFGSIYDKYMSGYSSESFLIPLKRA